MDVRTLAGSNHNPQFNAEALSGSLAEVGITYERVAAFGGLRGRAKEVDPAINGMWRNASFRNYADYALSNAFEAALADLIERSATQRIAIMCAEAVWWRCHRRIIADHLLAHGVEVGHLMGKGRIEPATLTPGAVVAASGSVTYPAPAAE